MRERTILHSDLNSFYASVEMMLDPSLRGKAVAVCGSTETRHGIVLAKQVSPLTLIIEPGKMRQTRGIVEALEYAPLVSYLLDTKGKRLAIQVTTAKDKQAVRFSKPEAEQGAKAVIYQNAEILSVIRGMMPEWDPEQKYAIDGEYSKNDKAIIFELEKATPYARRGKSDSPDTTEDTEE